MSRRLSFTKIEHEIIHSYRDRINTAATPEDISSAFGAAMNRLLAGAMGDKSETVRDSIAFDPKSANFYRLTDILAADGDFNTTMEESDLPQIISRFAETANRRRLRLMEHREKTEAKIRN